MKLSLMENLNEQTLHIVDEEGEHYEWSDILVSMEEVMAVMNSAGGAACMDSAEDRVNFLKGLIAQYNEADEEEEMQQVPDDAIILTPDEARAMLNASLGDQFDTDSLDEAIQALEDQLEEDYTDEY